MTNLKPCPFCGATGELIVTGKYSWGYAKEFWSAWCPKCKARTAESKDGHEYMGANEGDQERVKEQASEAWNTRVSPWRSLKDDPPLSGSKVLARRMIGRYRQVALLWWCPRSNDWLAVVPEISDADPEGADIIENALSCFDEYMELPE